MSIENHPALVARVGRILKPLLGAVSLWFGAGLALIVLGGCAQGQVIGMSELSPRSISVLHAPEQGHFLRPTPLAKARPVTKRSRRAKLRQRRVRKQMPAGPSQAHGRAPQAPGHSQVYRPQRSMDKAGRGASLRAQQRVEAAVAWLGTAGLQQRPFIADVLRSAGQSVRVPSKQGYARGLHDRLARGRRLLPVGAVQPGDLAFFRDTIDVNSNGRPDDGVTFVALVEKVESDRVVIVGRRAGSVRRMALSLSQPDQVRSASRVLNTRLVRWPGQKEAWTAGRCFVTWARP